MDENHSESMFRHPPLLARPRNSVCDAVLQRVIQADERHLQDKHHGGGIEGGAREENARL